MPDDAHRSGALLRAGVLEQAAVRRRAQVAVEHHAHGRVTRVPRRTHGEARVVGQHGRHAGHDGVDAAAQDLDLGLRPGAADPAAPADALGRAQLAGARLRPLGDDPRARTAQALAGEPAREEGVQLRRALDHVDLDALRPQELDALAAVALVRIQQAHDDALHAGGEHEVDAGRRLAVARARLERDDQGVPGRGGDAAPAGRFDRLDLRVRSAPAAVVAARDDHAAGHDRGADGRVGRDLETVLARFGRELGQQAGQPGRVQEGRGARVVHGQATPA